jgi:hypothetical protein
MLSFSIRTSCWHADFDVHLAAPRYSITYTDSIQFYGVNPIIVPEARSRTCEVTSTTRASEQALIIAGWGGPLDQMLVISTMLHPNTVTF